MKVFRHILLLLPLLLLIPESARAQQNFLGTEEIVVNGMSYNTFARAGEATIRVLVVGAGGGMYEIGANTKMDEFLALLGGTPEFANRQPGTRTNVDIEVYRIEDGRRSLLYDEELETMIMEPANYPTLQDGDVFTIRTVTRRRWGWRDGLSVVTGLSSVILLLDRLGVIDIRRN